MAKEFRLPELGENVEQASVASVLVSVGDTVSANQSVLEIETDKAVAEIPTDVSGKVMEIRVAVGDKIAVGDVVLVLDESGAGGKAPEPEAKPAPEPAKPAKKEPAPAPPPAPAATEAPTPRAPAAPVSPTPRSGPVLASPSVRRMARERGIDLKDVPVADPDRPVTAGDVLAYAKSLGGEDAAPAPAAPAAPRPAAAPAQPVADGDSDAWGAVTHEPMNAIRKKTAEHMAHCWSTIPHVTQFEKVDITGLEAVRKKHGARVKEAGGKLTVTVFVLKALAAALKRFPRMNASIDLERQEILLKHYYNLGVAVDTPNGLLVPVVRDVDRKSITDLAIELPEIAVRARERKLKMDEMQGATFTVTNLGGLGVTAFTPIINAPEVAILGVSKASIEPVFEQGQFVPRLLMPVSLSYDHRVIDGADAARFMAWLKEALEQPWSLFLDEA